MANVQKQPLTVYEPVLTEKTGIPFQSFPDDIVNSQNCFPMVLNTTEYRRSLESMTR